jgi:hypothetical protein
MALAVRLRRIELETQAAARGLDTQTDQARAIGVHVAIHNKILNGKTKNLSGPYVIGILWLFGGDCVRQALRQFFELDLDEQEPVAS